MHIFKGLETILSLSASWSSVPKNIIQITSDGSPQVKSKSQSNYRPVVLWHGLGDQYNSSGIHETAAIFDGIYPGIFVHSVYLDLDPDTDQKRSVFGDANRELDEVCEQLSAISELKDGFDLIGFSQGGLFSRALVERCQSVKVNNLITFGSPHLGVSELPLCENPGDWICRKKNELLKKQVWLDSVQKRVIPAQYFRDPVNYNQYVLHSNFLVDLNNEKPLSFNTTYKTNFAQLNRLVLIQFSRDTTLVPKETAWFVDYDESGSIVPFQQTKIFTQDLIGLKQLHTEGRIEFLALDTDHMVFSESFLDEIARNYLGIN